MKTSRASALGLVAALVLPSLAIALDPPPGGGYPNDTTALGDDALFSLQSTGIENTAIGFEALYGATSGSQNTAVGRSAMYGNTSGGADVAVGDNALYGNTVGTYNVAVGQNAMVANTTGGGSVVVGYTALESGTTGMQNTALGFGAMSFSTTAAYNTAVGADSLSFNSTGMKNTALGRGAMNMGAGSNNVAVGYAAGNTLSGLNNIAIGYNGGFNLTKGDNNIEIGNEGVKNDANLIRIGDTATQKKTFIAGISGATISNGVAVMVNSKGQLGVATSSARFKDDIQPMKDASDVLLSLQPVTFRYKKELDSLGTPQFGLVAEQVAKVDPDLVARDDSGKPYTVRYEAVNAMLLNEFLKEHRKVETLEEKVARLEATVEKQSALIEKVSAEQAAAHPATRLFSANE
ncbi:MAG TPA: tail fiber domain-containing protein [Chthoniobacterales bacterium]|jgi:hypothetical protein